MTRIPVGVLQPGARAIGMGVMGARRGVAMFAGVPRGVVVKACEPMEMAAECFCALLADALSVQAPPCGIVYEQGKPLFASIDLHSPNLMQQFCVNPDQPAAAELIALVQELSQWIGLGRLIAFDVLVRNADRHPGNLLTDGQDYWAIDHGRTLGLYTYEGHKSFRLIAAFSDVLTCANIEASAISQALTFPTAPEAAPGAALNAQALLSAFAQPFAHAVAARLPTLASSIKGLL